MKYRIVVSFIILLCIGGSYLGWAQAPSKPEAPEITYALVPGQEAVPLEQKVIQQVTTEMKTFTVQEIFQQMEQVDQELVRLIQIRDSLRQLLLLAQQRLGLTEIPVPPGIELTPVIPEQEQKNEQGEH
jgi:hypothetical protein